MATKKETKTTKVKKTTKKVDEALDEAQVVTNLATAYDIDNIDGLSVEDVANIYDKMVQDFTESLNDKSLKELSAMEEEIVKKANEWDVEIRSKTYTLKDNTIWRDKEVTRTQIGAKIRAILDKFECEYKYTLGMYQMALWWSAPKSEIQFGTLDSTLRVLGQPSIKYKGPHEWENILIVDQYFKECNAAYSKDTLRTYMFADRHNAILNKIDEIKKLESPLAPQADQPDDEAMPESVAQEL